MIFVSIALLVVAGISLGIGIVSSSVPPLVVSILATLAAAGTLWASFIHYRKEAAEHGVPVAGLGGNVPRNPGYPEAYAAGNPTIAPAVAANTNPAATAVAPPAAVAVPERPSPVPAGWDGLDEDRAAALVATMNLAELHELRRHEVEHGFRTRVVEEIDQRITTIVDLRRRANGSDVERPLRAR